MFTNKYFWPVYILVLLVSCVQETDVTSSTEMITAANIPTQNTPTQAIPATASTPVQMTPTRIIIATPTTYLPIISRPLPLHTVYPTELAGYIPNPEMGWQSTRYARPIRFSATTLYSRFNWRDFNPENGVYDWSLIETLRQDALERDQKIHFRIRNDQTPPWGPGQVLPDWVLEQGAVIIETERGPEPLYSDCIFLDTHATFVDAFRQQYDGDPDIVFLDIGAYGHFGEWGTDQYDSTVDSLDWHARRRLADMYLGGAGTRPCQYADGSIADVTYDYAGFQTTQLLMPYTPGRKGTLFYTLDKRSDVGIRHDAIGSERHQDKYREEIGELVEQTWQHAPIVFEFSSSSYTPEALARARAFVQEMHGSLLHDNFGGLGNDDQILSVLEVVGFRLVLQKVTYTNKLRTDDLFSIDMEWENEGSAPSYTYYPLLVTLVDEYGYVEWEHKLNVDVRDMQPNTPFVVNEKFSLPAELPIGIYELQLSFADPYTWQPILNIAIEGQNENGRYPLGPVTIIN